MSSRKKSSYSLRKMTTRLSPQILAKISPTIKPK
jgi:hypothetical protein